MKKVTLVTVLLVVILVDFANAGRSSGREPRILDGTVVSSRQTYPYAARIVQSFLALKAFTTQCGGALVAKSWVLTAGICLSKISRKLGFSKSKKSIVQVTLGDLSSSSSTDNSEFNTKGTTVFHPNFQEQQYIISNDIGLVRLWNEAPLGPNIQPISLPPDSWTRPADGTSVETIGWGVYSFFIDSEGISGAVSTNLRSGTLSVTADQNCKDANFQYAFLSDQMMCLGASSLSAQIPCQLDEGGPVIQSSLTAGNILMGIVSKIGWETTDCLKHRNYTVITNVHPYLTWIRQNIG